MPLALQEAGLPTDSYRCISEIQYLCFSWRGTRQGMYYVRASRNCLLLVRLQRTVMDEQSKRPEFRRGSDGHRWSQYGHVLTARLTWGSPIPRIPQSGTMCGTRTLTVLPPALDVVPVSATATATPPPVPQGARSAVGDGSVTVYPISRARATRWSQRWLD